MRYNHETKWITFSTFTLRNKKKNDTHTFQFITNRVKSQIKNGRLVLSVTARRQTRTRPLFPPTFRCFKWFTFALTTGWKVCSQVHWLLLNTIVPVSFLRSGLVLSFARTANVIFYTVARSASGRSLLILRFTRREESRHGRVADFSSTKVALVHRDAWRISFVVRKSRCRTESDPAWSSTGRSIYKAYIPHTGRFCIRLVVTSNKRSFMSTLTSALLSLQCEYTANRFPFF